MFDLFMSIFMFYVFLNISLTNDISFFDQKENVWPIYVFFMF